MQHAEIVWRDDAMLGEAPVWDERAGAVRWINTPAGVIHEWVPTAGCHRILSLNETTGCIADAGPGRLVAARRHDVVLVSLSDGAMTPIATALDPRETLLLNDGKCGPDGALWVGVMAKSLAPASGSLIRVAPDGQVNWMIHGLTLPNGIAWSEDGRRMFLVDSLARTVTAFPMPFDASRGELVVRVDESFGLPDGVAIDCEGYLWIAHWGGGAIRRWDPQSGAMTQEIALPVSQPTSCCFGGPDRRTLYITSAWETLSDIDRIEQPLAGSLFAAQVTVPGVRVGCFGAPEVLKS